MKTIDATDFLLIDHFTLPDEIVYLSLSSYGHPLLFLFTALSGSAAVIQLRLASTK